MEELKTARFGLRQMLSPGEFPEVGRLWHRRRRFAELMFVGEAPGADEDEQGEPFVGKAGELLTRIIQTMGFSRETVYIANVLKCRPDTPGQTIGNRKPTSDEMKTCLPYLLEQIDIIQPRVIVALGATAVEGLFGKPMPITKLRGNWQTFRKYRSCRRFIPRICCATRR